MDDFEFDENIEEYVTEETVLELDEDYNPNDFGEVWHPDIAETFGFSY